jgi:hypothetical protein
MELVEVPVLLFHAGAEVVVAGAVDGIGVERMGPPMDGLVSDADGVVG